MLQDDLDDIVQGLAVAKYALEAGDVSAAGNAVESTLAKARQLLSDNPGAAEHLLRRRATC